MYFSFVFWVDDGLVMVGQKECYFIVDVTEKGKDFQIACQKLSHLDVCFESGHHGFQEETSRWRCRLRMIFVIISL